MEGCYCTNLCYYAKMYQTHVYHSKLCTSVHLLIIATWVYKISYFSDIIIPISLTNLVPMHTNNTNRNMHAVTLHICAFKCNWQQDYCYKP